MFSRGTFSKRAKSVNKPKINPAEFFDSIKNNDTEKFQSFLENPDFILWEQKDENDFTALHYSVKANNYDLSKLIVEEVKKGFGLRGGSKLANYINEKNKEGITAVHFAVINGNITMLVLLKNFGGNLEVLTNKGKNVIHLAAESNQPSMMIHLLANEAKDVFSTDENGSTALHWACYFDAEEAVNYLLNLNANINAQDKEKLTPLHLAVANNKVSIVRLLMQRGADKNIRNKKDELPIDIARKKNNEEIINILDHEPYNPLCTIEAPKEYIKPNDFYKKLILIEHIVQEVIIFFLVLPFLESIAHTFVSLILFGLCLLSYFLLLAKDPGYQYNDTIFNIAGYKEYSVLKKLLNDGKDLKFYCPTCYIKFSSRVKHCFICNKCVLDMSHHCFWFNKCIGKKNKIMYFIFLIIEILYHFYSMFICIYLIFDRVIIPYDMLILPISFYQNFDRGFRVLGAGVVVIVTIVLSFPLFFLNMIEIFKLAGLIEKKQSKQKYGDEPLIDNIINDNANIINDTSSNIEQNGVELRDKIDNEPLLGVVNENENENDNNIINNNDDNNIINTNDDE